MTALISLLNLNWFSFIFSQYVRFFLAARGVKVGKNFQARALPILVKDKESKIIIGNNVFFKDRVDLRSTKGATLNLDHGVKLDKEVRIVATNGAKVQLDENADIGCYTIFNCGTDLYVGKDVLMAGFCYLQTSNHNTLKDKKIKSQGYTHKPINIGNDCWLGGGCFILPGVTLGDGVVVGANSIVNKDIQSYSIVAGNPAKTISIRK